jgi:hypothetical protein
MQARRSISLLVTSIVTALAGVGAQADVGSPTTPVEAAASGSAAMPATDVATPVATLVAAPEFVVTPNATRTANTSNATDAVAGATTPATAAATSGFGVAMTADQLDERRGGDALVGQNFLTGAVTDNLASRVQTGSNTISEGSFASSSGLPTVIQNTGANVLIQNATVLNVRFGN